MTDRMDLRRPGDPPRPGLGYQPPGAAPHPYDEHMRRKQEEQFGQAQQPEDQGTRAFSLERGMEKAGELATSVAEGVAAIPGKVADLASGASRREFDLPSFVGAEEDPGLGVAAGYATQFDPERVAGVIEEQLPDAKISRDKFNNPIVDWRGKRYYVNRPGFDRTDLFQAVAGFMQFLPAARMAGAAKSVMGRAGLGGVGEGATAITQDIAGKQLDPDMKIDWRKAVAAATGAAISEPASTMAARAWSAMPWSRGIVDAAGNLTEEGAAAARAAGMNPDDFTPQMARRFENIYRSLPEVYKQQVRRADDRLTDATRAAVTEGAAQAEADVVDIPLTLGQRTQNLRQLNFEDKARQGTMGESAQKVMREHDELAKRKTGEAIEGMQERLSDPLSRSALPDEQAAGQLIREQVQAEASTLDEAIDAAYQAVRDAGPPVRIRTEGVLGLATATRQALKDRILARRLTPLTMDAIKDLVKLHKLAGRPRKPGPRITKLTLTEVEKYRRMLNSSIAKAKEALKPGDKSQDAAALGIMKEQLDNWIDDLFDQGLMDGDPNTLTLLKDARALRREYGKKFQEDNVGNVVARTIGKMIHWDATNQDIVDWIIGVGQYGGKNTSVPMVRKLKEIFANNPDGWNAVREAAFMRMIYGPKQLQREALAPQRMANNLREYLKGRQRELTQELFSPEEIGQLAQFEDHIRKRIMPASEANPSRTSHELIKSIQQMMRIIVPGSVAMMDPTAGAAAIAGTMGAGAAGRALGGRAARRAIAPAKFTPRSMPWFSAAGTTAAVGSQELPEVQPEAPQSQAEPEPAPQPAMGMPSPVKTFYATRDGELPDGTAYKRGDLLIRMQDGNYVKAQ